MLILTGYSIAIVLASLLGGWLLLLVRMTHTRTQLAMSFVAGMMLGVALYHLLPHALLQLQVAQDTGAAFPGAAIETAVWWIMLGLVIMLILLRVFHFHQHDFSDEHHSQLERRPGAHPLSWLGIALGLSLHALIDGVSLGASIKSDLLRPDGVGLVGFGVFMAILLHKPLEALSITSVMQAGGRSVRARAVANVMFALMCPVGALLFFWGIGQLAVVEAALLGRILSFATGVFLCIALSDLLPEIHFHSHDRVKLALALLLGIGLAWVLRFLEPGIV